MPADAGAAQVGAIHATAVAIGDFGLLIVGKSKSGKSRLALALVDLSRPTLPIDLVGDDRVLLSLIDGRLVARPHPRIAGFVERRGLGIQAIAHRAEVEVAAAVVLGAASARSRDDLPPNLPALAFVDGTSLVDRRDATLAWIAGLPWPARPGTS